MNILVSSLPTKLKVNQKIYEINYDFRTIIRVLQAFEDNELTYGEQLHIMLKNIYKDDIPDEDFEEACLKAIKFIDLGKESNSKKPENRIYSFEKDAGYIFSGIMSTHHLDLEKENQLHWWKFMALFMDMSNDCTFAELIYYRKRKMEGKLNSEELKNYKQIKEIVDLDYEKIESEERKEFFRQFHSS